MLMEKLANRPLGNTTHYYLSVETDNRKDPRSNYKYSYLELRYPRQWETFELDNLFPTIKQFGVNTCSKFFFGTTSDQWSV